MPTASFTADITAIRKRARQRMEERPVTGSYGQVASELTEHAEEEEHADDIIDLLGG
jgi:hypothetical protein